MDMIGVVGASSRMETQMEDKTWNTAVEKYLARREQKSKDDWTATEKLEKGYLSRIGRAICDSLNISEEQLKTLPLERVDDDLVEEITKQLLVGRKASTVNRNLVVLRRLLRLSSTRWKWFREPPAFVEMLEEETPERRWLTKEEAKRLISECRGQLRDKVIIALGTGMRDANVRGLRWEWIDFSRRAIIIPKRFMKARKDFATVMSDEVYAVLKKISRRSSKHDELVFPYNGKVVHRSGARAFRKARERAEVPWCKWHTLRHTWASWKIQDKVPPHMIQRMGGWESPKMLGIYAHVDIEHMREYQSTGFLS